MRNTRLLKLLEYKDETGYCYIYKGRARIPHRELYMRIEDRYCVVTKLSNSFMICCESFRDISRALERVI